MSITPYTSFEVTDLNNDKQPYVNSSTEFGYFGNVGAATADTCNSMPTFLLSNNGIATVDPSSGLSILQPGIYTLNVSIDCSATNLTTGVNFAMNFNFGTTRLVNIPITSSTIDSFGQIKGFGMYSFGDSATTYPGIISWLTDDETSGSNPTTSNYLVFGSGYLWYVYNTNCNTNTSFMSGILTTKITFIINEPTTIYFNTYCSVSLTMGTSYFTLKTVQIFTFVWSQLGTINNLPAIGNWAPVASSSDGTKLVAGRYGTFLYTSTNSGVSWNQLGTSNGLPSAANWFSIASSDDGTKLAVVVTNGGIWTSAFSGVSWSQQTLGLPTTARWQSIASSSDGSKLAAVVDAGTIYTLSNFGATWSARTDGVNPSNGLPATAKWYSIASSSDGSMLAAVDASGGGIYTSTNSGVSWNLRTSGLPTTANWRYIASSSDGTKLAAVVFGGGIWRSTNSGVSWSQQTLGLPANANWYSIASSSDGSKLAAVVYGGGIYMSSNSGATWYQQIAGLPAIAKWHTIASSSDGTKLIAVVDDGGVYIYTGVVTY